jgi:hypothetical protein
MKDDRGYGKDPRLFVERGQRFGRLTVIDPEVRKQVPSVPAGIRAALCQCDCGSRVTMALTLLTRRAQSCGCIRLEVATAALERHGQINHPLYATHHGMMQRCYDRSHQAYQHYGARDITVCKRWHDIRAFIADIERDLGPRPDGMTLDRIDNDGNYEPGNMRWATRSEQNRNQRKRRVA